MATVKVYSTPTCMYCNLLKDFLDEKNVEYSAIDVSTDEAARNYVVEKSGQMGVPVTEIIEDGEDDGMFIIGFDQATISEKLGL